MFHKIKTFKKLIVANQLNFFQAIIFAFNYVFSTKFLQIDPIKIYVGSNEISGKIQFELLKKEGCTPTSKVLEVGCGSLHLGIPLINFLEKENYVGIDPNDWLRKKVMKKKKNQKLFEQKEVNLLNISDFDVSKISKKFDFIFAHSVLSHCAHWQLEQFLQNTSKVLTPTGKILASIRLAEGNNFGSHGSIDKKDSMDDEWQYPGVSWFKISTINKMAKKFNLKVEHKPEHGIYYVQTRPNEFHDWLVFTPFNS